MAVKAATLETELIDAVCARVRERLPDDQARPCQSFVRQYYQWVPAEDLAERDQLDLYGAALQHYTEMQRRAEGEIKVEVYNPTFEHHGWSSPHTVVEIVSDDMPFLVDSVTMELARQGYSLHLVIHPVIRVRRDDKGNLIDIVEPGAEAENTIAESVLHAEVARESDPARQDQLARSVERVLREVHAAVADWHVMRGRAETLVGELDEHEPSGLDPAGIEEAQAFLHWLTHDHFTFLGYREYEFVSDGEQEGLKAIPDSGLGILRGAPVTPYTKLRPRAQELARSPHALVITKANTRATVHRPAYLDYIGVKKFDQDGAVIGERRFLGLYTSIAYKASAREIPIVRGKVDYVLERAGFPPDSHDYKALVEILESYPRDSMFQVEGDDLFDIAIGILALGERQRLRLFVRRDRLDRFVECLVCIPRDRFNTENRERIARILKDTYRGSHIDWFLQLSESLLARVHYIVHCPDGAPEDVDLSELETRLVKATRAWNDDLRAALIEEHGEDEAGKIFRAYERAFPPAYRDERVARSAVADIGRIEELGASNEPIMSLYRPLEAPAGLVRCKLFSAQGVSLSDVLPTFEHMGAKVVDERPYEISPTGRTSVYLYDFGLQGVAEDVDRVRDIFQETFLGVWRGDYEDDSLNGLVLRAGLTGRQIDVIRAVAKYLRQAGIAFSDAYMERTLLGQAKITKLLVSLFTLRFDPDRDDRSAVDTVVREIEQQIDAVESLDEDRILRAFLSVVRAILRTNYFQFGADNRPAAHVSFKLDPSLIPVLPLPRPTFEIFVYSPRVEGVHLRGGKVARGGLRWSDRREDFRTEILGLMKAQMVKNALIVPVGSKGGFVLKRPPSDGGREALQAEAIACYRTFLSGLLDITDNIVAGDVVAPDRVVRYDEDDPYLVVAADKGTATFSDIANEISAEYGFWLGDAFASGGSQGYDHKAMGITARGAWESVKRHFRELGIDIQQEDFTVVGVGDMSGDVFGNGMLLSPHIKLLGAFNHAHVFLDPDPDPERSFAGAPAPVRASPLSVERLRHGSSSPAGGGVYPRTAKSIPISDEVREALAIDARELSPTELIREILRAPVDLLWNGGIGTYVKASAESHADAGDKTNDAVRLDGSELRCRVVGEGGNLGFTQRGRIEYALAGGRINTDAIDNVAGVNCSDHEVNIKILLDALVAAGDLTEKQRNELLVDDDRRRRRAGAARQLHPDAGDEPRRGAGGADGRRPRPADPRSRADRRASPRARVPARRRDARRAPQQPPGARRARARGGDGVLQDPPVRALLESDLPEDPYLAHDLDRYFPPPLPERYAQQMRRHRLRREIIATVVANQLVDRAGSTFLFRLQEETGAPVSILARGVRRRARGLRHARVLGGRRGARQPGRRADADRDADRGPPARRARDALAGAPTPNRSTSPADRDTSPRRAAARCGAAGRARRV